MKKKKSATELLSFNVEEFGEQKVLLALNNMDSDKCTPLLHQLWNACPVKVCADGAANVLWDESLTPNYVFGDLDSIRPDVFNAITLIPEVVLHPDANQDTNDMEKCLVGISRFPNSTSLEVIVFGAFGGRIDHEMANLHAALKYTPCFSRLLLCSPGNMGQVLLSGVHQFSVVPGTVCGLLPIFGKVWINQTEGLKWNLNQQELAFGGLISSSNQVEKDVVTISTAGAVLFTLHFL